MCIRDSGRPCRHDAELLHHRQGVQHAPVLVHETVATEAKDVDELHVDALASCRHAHEFTPVGSRVTRSHNDLVTACYDVLSVYLHVGERCSLHPEEVLDPRLRGRKTRRLFVFDEIVSQAAAEPVDISSVQKVVEASRRSRVVHRVSSSWGCRQGSVHSPEAAVYPPVSYTH